MKRSPKPNPKPLDWSRVTDDELLKKRICDLPISLDGTQLVDWIHEVYAELSAKGIDFHPEVYLGDEWFSPEGDPVVSIPFYLAQPRLIDLEKRRVLEAEGEDREQFLRLLRHEMGHALAHAYGLYNAKGYDRHFGDSDQDYPEAHHPRPYSRKFVRHLDNWYAQTHPDEDFAETFAIWLTPKLDWKKEYARWGAIKKLEFVDRLMRAIRHAKPKKKSGPKWRRLSTIKMTIGRYQQTKKKEWAEDFPDFFDGDLRRIFVDSPESSRRRASKFLRDHRPLLVKTISHWAGEKRITIHDLVTRFAERSEELGLYVPDDETLALTTTASCLTAMAANYFLTGRYKRPR
ncbi:MAG: hypothetical protein COB53_12560 [Elusimicrobia bacterium]|nr:MAG: hypothetical protein COB53_12560 [Elusimicrobiota bacterium]